MLERLDRVDAARSVWKPVRIDQTVRGKVQPPKMSELRHCRSALGDFKVPSLPNLPAD